MRKTAIAIVTVWLVIASAATAQTKQPVAGGTPPLEAKVRKLWENFKNKDKAGLSAMLDDNFRMFEEGLTAFADKKAEVNAVDDFTVKPLSPTSALVTYIAQYEGKSGGQSSKAKSVFAEVWTRTGKDWKNLYLQETYVK
jgi:hypothetical protein